MIRLGLKNIFSIAEWLISVLGFKMKECVVCILREIHLFQMSVLYLSLSLSPQASQEIVSFRMSCPHSLIFALLQGIFIKLLSTEIVI
jgi:hypothetical protein